LDGHPPSYASLLAGITGMDLHTWLIGWDGALPNFLPILASNYDPSDFYLLRSWDYRSEPPYLAGNSLLRYNARVVQVIHWNCRGQWLVVHPQVTIITVPCRTFSPTQRNPILAGTDQSKVDSQWGYIEKPLRTLTLDLMVKDRTVK
jgi:hypothetical protein